MTDRYDQDNARDTYAAEHGAPFNMEPAYVADGWSAGIAWRVTHYETEHVYDEPTLIDDAADPDDESNYAWDEEGYERPTGNLVAHMIGDDRDFTFEPADLTPIADDEYCAGCGQVGCGWC